MAPIFHLSQSRTTCHDQIPTLTPALRQHRPPPPLLFDLNKTTPALHRERDNIVLEEKNMECMRIYTRAVGGMAMSGSLEASRGEVFGCGLFEELSRRPGQSNSFA